MTNLSHWMYADDFTAREAAFLILGVDPSSSDAGNHNASHIKKRLDGAYNNAVKAFICQTGADLGYDFYESFDALPKQAASECASVHEQLWSIELEDGLCKLIDGNEESENLVIRIHEPRFSRKNLAKWLRENRLVSAYQFETTGARISSAQGHTTYLTAKLEEANKKFWTLYDPSDRSTAPTNEQIAIWLMGQGVSKRTAEVMASMLRADDLPVGRR